MQGTFHVTRPRRLGWTAVIGLALVASLWMPHRGDRALAQGGAPRPDESRFNVVTLIPPGELDEPMTFAVTTDGRVFVNERRTGHIKMYDPLTKLTQIIATVPVNHQYTSASGAPREAEEGFVGITLDPNFDANGFIYVMFADRDVAKHVVGRLTLAPETLPDGTRTMRAVPDSFRTLLEYSVQREQCCHTGGGMVFDNDGNLFITVGNNTSNSAGSQTDERAGREPWDDQRGSANTNDLRGKILRIHPEPDGTYTIPEGNLFPPGTPNTRPEIFSMGHRNPWRVSVDSATGYVYWGEVGPDNQVDNPDIGPRGYDELNQARGPGFFGWPYFVGNNQAFPFRNYVTGELLGPKDPERPTNTSVNNDGLQVLPPAEPAFVWYPSATSDEFPDVGSGGRCAEGGPVYRRADFAADADRPWPAYYEGKWLATDCSRGWILSISMDADSRYAGMERFLPTYRPSEPMDIKFGPEGDLYVLDYGSTWFAKSDDSELVRIEYNGGNRTPVVMASADRIAGVPPFDVALSAAGTMDYDGDALQYAWTFQPLSGGSARTLSGANPRVTIDQNGLYTATLTVTDAAGASASAIVDLVAGNDPPTVAVTLDTTNQTFFNPSAPLNYRVAVTDREDGSVPPERVAFSVNYVPETFDADAIRVGQARVDAATKYAVARALVAGSDCALCHNLTGDSRGPSMERLAERYANPDDLTMATLVNKVRSGGTGVWGTEVMPAHPQVSPTQAQTIIEYFLGAGDERLASAPLAGAYEAPMRDADSARGQIVLHAAYTDQGSSAAPSVTSETLRVLRSPVVDPALADVREGVQLPTGRGTATGVIARHGSYVAFRDVDLTGVRSIDIAATTGGRGSSAIGGSIEVRLGSPTGTVIGQGSVVAGAGGGGGGRGGGFAGAGGRGGGAAAGRGGRGAAGGSAAGPTESGAIAQADAEGFAPRTDEAAVADAAPIGRGGGGAGAGAGRGGGVAVGALGEAQVAGGGRGAGPQAAAGGGRAGGTGRGGGFAAPTPTASVALTPTTGLQDVYVVFTNPEAGPNDQLMTVTTMTFAQ